MVIRCSSHFSSLHRLKLTPGFLQPQLSQGLEDAVLRNIQAVSELSDLVRTSFGPNGSYHHYARMHGRNLIGSVGRNKLIINHLGRLFVTSDAATIIREIEVVHPAAKLLVMASQAQESEVRLFPTSATPSRFHSLAGNN